MSHVFRVFLSASLLACTAGAQAGEASNALHANGIRNNGLGINGLDSNGVTLNRLAFNGANTAVKPRLSGIALNQVGVR